MNAFVAAKDTFWGQPEDEISMEIPVPDGYEIDLSSNFKTIFDTRIYAGNGSVYSNIKGKQRASVISIIAYGSKVGFLTNNYISNRPAKLKQLKLGMAVSDQIAGKYSIPIKPK